MVNRRLLRLDLIAILLYACGSVAGQIDFDGEPIRYSSRPTRDPVSELRRRLEAGEARLAFDQDHGWLKSLLRALDISPSSQMLVFSKTSFQPHQISPATPRALYFNDHTYVGWVQGGDVIEVSSMDPEQGAVFFTLRQQESKSPTFIRGDDSCMICHASSRTKGVPGHIVRSVYPFESGLPHYGAGSFRTDHTSPLRERWGGWYVTGTHGRQRHMGNVVVSDSDDPKLDVEAGANVTDLGDRVRTDAYLTGHSDIVALMVLEHQSDMHNFITHAGYEARMALHQNAIMNRVLERPADHVSATTKRRIASASERLLKYLLFVDEARLTDRITGTTTFAKDFAARGRRDGKGRSLRDLDLEGRLFRYPCSYLIHSPSFRSLPVQVRTHVYGRLLEILTGHDVSGGFEHLSTADRRAIHEILLDTHEGLPNSWRSDD